MWFRAAVLLGCLLVQSTCLLSASYKYHSSQIFTSTYPKAAALSACDNGNNINSKSIDATVSEKTTKDSVQHFDATAKSISDLPNIPDWLQQNCKRLGFKHLTSVQSTAIPVIMSGEDVILQAQTGSGKTLAYSIPLLSAIDPSRAAIQVVIVAPTRELGLQIASVLKQLTRTDASASDKIGIMSLLDGSKNTRQMIWATAEPPHIVVGNAKPLSRLVDSGRLRLNAVNMVVIDEVDACLLNTKTKQDLHALLSRRLSNTFQSKDTAEEELNSANPLTARESIVYKNLAKDQRDMLALRERFRSQRQTVMVSATIPQRQHFAQSCQKNGWTEQVPTLIHLSANQLLPLQLQHYYVPCANDVKFGVLQFVLLSEFKKSLKTHASASASDRAESQTSGKLNLKAKLLAKSKSKSIASVGDEEPVSTTIASTSASASVPQMILFVDETSVVEKCRVVALNAVRKFLMTDATGLSSNTSASLDERALAEKVQVLTEDMDLNERSSALKDYRNGKCLVLITTDIATRGIDIPNTTHVIQLALPKTTDIYLHRSGRTGRMSRSGTVVTLTQPLQEDFIVKRFMNELGIEIKKRVIKLK